MMAAYYGDCHDFVMFFMFFTRRWGGLRALLSLTDWFL